MIGSSRALGGGISYKAGGTIHIARFVKFDSTSPQLVESTSGDASMGIMQEGMRDPPGLTSSTDATVAATSGDTGTFFVYQGGDSCRLWMVNAVTAGQMIKASTGGKGTPHTSGAALCTAIALEAGNPDELVRVLVLQANTYVSL